MPRVKKFLLCILFLVWALAGAAQSDSARPATVQTNQSATINDSDTTRIDSATQAAAQHLKDSLATDSARKSALPPAPVIDTTTYRSFAPTGFLPLNKPTVYMLLDYRVQESKDELFYLLIGVVFVLAFTRAAFSKYFRNMFGLFLQTSIRQRQTREQLLQEGPAALLTNFLFVISAGLYITLLIAYKGWSDLPFWWLAGGSAAALTGIYLVKYLFLLFMGWLFNAREAAGSYAFVVFLVNRIIGVVLVPFLLVLAFAGPDLVQVSVTVSAGVVLLLLGYRYWVSFLSIRGKLKVNALHFLLYLCAVELLPLALICKVLTNYFNGSL